MTLDDLAALEKEATKGEWKYTVKVEDYPGEGTYVVEAGSGWLLSNCTYYNTAPQRNEDAAFIAAIRNAAPMLIEIARAAKEWLEADTIAESSFYNTEQGSGGAEYGEAMLRVSKARETLRAKLKEVGI